MNDTRRLFKRIVQAEMDLHHAADCAEQILDRELHSAAARADKRLLRCLNTALIVSYWAPFSKSRASMDVQKRLPGEYLEVFSQGQKLLHTQIGQARNRDIAHSDPDGRSVKVSLERLGGAPVASTISRDAHAPLPRKTVEELTRMIELLRGRLCEEHLRLQQEVTLGEKF